MPLSRPRSSDPRDLPRPRGAPRRPRRGADAAPLPQLRSAAGHDTRPRGEHRRLGRRLHGRRAVDRGQPRERRDDVHRLPRDPAADSEPLLLAAQRRVAEQELHHDGGADPRPDPLHRPRHRAHLLEPARRQVQRHGLLRRRRRHLDPQPGVRHERRRRPPDDRRRPLPGERPDQGDDGHTRTPSTTARRTWRWPSAPSPATAASPSAPRCRSTPRPSARRSAASSTATSRSPPTAPPTCRSPAAAATRSCR